MQKYMVTLNVLENPFGISKHSAYEVFECEVQDVQNKATEAVTEIVAGYVINIADVFLPYIDTENIKLTMLTEVEIPFKMGTYNES